jgi:effector-binding domain-containing protein
MAGAPFTHYLDYDENTGISNYVAGVRVSSAGIQSGEVYPIEYGEMRVARAMHTGPYTGFPDSYAKMGRFIQTSGEEMIGESFEFYLTDPSTEPDRSRWQTIIAFVLK